MGKWSKELGNQGENTACEFLQQQGYKILARNYYATHCELDIIAEENNLIVFVEVKNYSFRSLGSAVGALGKTKRQNLIFAAQRYLKDNHIRGRYARFDAVLIYRDHRGNQNIKHYKNVFYIK